MDEDYVDLFLRYFWIIECKKRILEHGNGSTSVHASRPPKDKKCSPLLAYLSRKENFEWIDLFPHLWGSGAISPTKPIHRKQSSGYTAFVGTPL